jgi:hypothetical protein
MSKAKLPKVCHCGSGKYPGIMRNLPPAPGEWRDRLGWCCGECHNDRLRCPGAARATTTNDDGERLSCEECGESFNVNESGSEDYCQRHAVDEQESAR